MKKIIVLVVAIIVLIGSGATVALVNNDRIKAKKVAGTSEVNIANETTEELATEHNAEKQEDSIVKKEATTEELTTEEPAEKKKTTEATQVSGNSSVGSSGSTSDQDNANNQTNNNNGSSGSAEQNSNSSQIVQTTPAPQVSPEPAEPTTEAAGCSHNWQEVTEHFTYEYPVYVDVPYDQCNQCGTKFYGPGLVEHLGEVKDENGNDKCWSYTSGLVESVVDHYETDEWDEVTGYKCSICGEERDR